MPDSGKNEPYVEASWFASDPTSYSLMLEMNAALGSAEALRELVEVAEQHAVRINGMSAGDLADEHPSASRVSPALRESLDALFGGLEREQAAAVDALNTDDIDIVAFQTDPVAAALKLFQPLDMPEAAARVTSLVAQLVQSPDATAYTHVYLRSVVRRPWRPRAFPAILSAVCSEAEQLVAAVLRRALFNAGGWSSILDPALDDAVHKIIGSGGAVEKWRAELALRGVELSVLTIEWPLLAEVFARRNLFVHRRGRVDAAYAKRAPVPAPELGSVIELDAQYLREAIDRCEVLATAAIAGLLKAGTPEVAEQIAGLATDLAVTATAMGALVRAEGYEHLAGALTDDPMERERHRVNCWLLREQRLGADAIQSEVEAWDVDALPRAFRLARYILLREDEAGLALLTELRADGTLTLREIQHWPLFARWRESALV